MSDRKWKKLPLETCHFTIPVRVANESQWLVTGVPRAAGWFCMVLSMMSGLTHKKKRH